MLAALGWLVGALVVAGLLVWGSLRGAMKSARLQREGAARREDEAPPPAPADRPDD